MLGEQSFWSYYLGFPARLAIKGSISTNNLLNRFTKQTDNNISSIHQRLFMEKIPISYFHVSYFVVCCFTLLEYFCCVFLLICQQYRWFIDLLDDYKLIFHFLTKHIYNFSAELPKNIIFDKLIQILFF